jgi:heme exporter protein D
MAEFFAMGGYAVFVWSSYAIAFISMVITFVWPSIQKRRLLKKLKQAQVRKAQLARRKS